MPLVNAMACQRCGAPVEPESFDLQCWVVLDAREEGWALYLCPDCQTAAERERLLLLDRGARVRAAGM